MKIEDVLQTTRFNDEQHKATLNLLYTAYWLKTNFNSTMKDNGITMEQFNVMRILKGKYPQTMCVKDIAGRMIEKSSNVPRILDKLIAKKMVKKITSKTDKRETLIALTDKGLKQLEEANADMKATSDKTIALSTEDATMLNEILERMRLVD